MDGTKPVNKMKEFVHRNLDGASAAPAERTEGSPTPAPRREGVKQNVFVKPHLPTTTRKRSQQSNAAATRTGSRHQQHPVLERKQDTHISAFDTDGESVGDTTLDDTLTVSNQTYQNQQYSYPAESNAMDIDHLPIATYAHNIAVSGASPYSGTVPEVQRLGVAADSRYEHGLAPAALAATMRTLGTWTVQYNEAHAKPGVQNRGGSFESGASYPATSKSGLTDAEMRGVREDVGSDDERGQSGESQDEESESSEEDGPTDQQSDGAEEHEIYREQQRQVQPPQQAAVKRSDQTQHEKPLASRSASHQRAANSGQGQHRAALATTQQEDARLKQEAALIEQKRRDQGITNQQLRLEEELRNSQWAQQEEAQATAHKKQLQNGSQQRFSDSAQQQRTSNIAQAQTLGSNGNLQSVVLAPQAASLPATRQGQSEASQNAKLDPKQPSSGKPQITVLEVAPQGEKLVQLDYDEADLRQMEYATLRNQSFDHNPQSTKSVLPDGMQSSTLDEKLKFVTRLDEKLQQSFFQSLSLEDWELAGDWFIDQFSALMKKMRQTRQGKRQIAMSFEKALSKRHDAVCQKREQIDDVLKGMRQSGNVVLNVSSTPQKTKPA